MPFIKLRKFPSSPVFLEVGLDFPSPPFILVFGHVSMSFPFSCGYSDMGLHLSPPPLLQVKAALDVLAQKIATFTDVGNSLAHVEHLLKDLTSFEEKSSVRSGPWTGVGRRQPGEAVLTVSPKLLRKAQELAPQLPVGG